MSTDCRVDKQRVCVNAALRVAAWLLSVPILRRRALEKVKMRTANCKRSGCCTRFGLVRLTKRIAKSSESVSNRHFAFRILHFTFVGLPLRTGPSKPQRWEIFPERCYGDQAVASWSTINVPMLSAEVAAGDGAFSTLTMRSVCWITKSSTMFPSGEIA